jgi:cytoskeletal protein RodZ
MDGFEKRERIREAQRRLIAQRNRAGRLRGRVVAASLICFALLWGVVFAQMATGNDPVLGEKSAAASRKAKRHSAGRAARSRRTPVESEVETAPETEFEAEPEPEVEPEFEAEPEVEAEPEPEVEVQPEVEAELEPLTTSQS